MNRLLVLAFALATTVSALAAPALRDLELRAYYHDPVRPAGAFHLKGSGGTLVPLALMSEGLSKPCKAILLDDELILYRSASEVAARMKVPANVKRAAVIIVLASDENASPPCRMIAIDDSPTAFSWGSSQAVNLLGVEIALEAGEHRLALPAGKITPVPAVEKLDEFKMAQVNFYFREEKNWVPFTERRMQFTKDLRRIFLVHTTPGSQRPFVATLVDYPPPEGI